MNILFVSVSAPPKSGPESLQVAKYLKYLSAQTNVTLVKTAALSTGWEKIDKSQLRFLESVHKTIELKSINAFNRWQAFAARNLFARWAGRPDADFMFHWQVKRVLKQLDADPDVIYSRSLPFSSALLALKLKMKLNKPWVMHLSDPWSDSPYGQHSNAYNKNAERECFFNADMTSFTTIETLTYYRNKYPELEKRFFVAPNVYDKSDVVQNPVMFTNDKLICLHSGNLYGARTIKPLIDALRLADEATLNNLELQLAGNMDEYNKRVIDESGLRCVKYFGAVSASESYALQRKSDVLISIDKPAQQEVDKILLPSKIQDYIAARKFIVGITAEASSTYNTVNKRYGLCFDPHDNKAISVFFNQAATAYRANDAQFFSIAEPDNEFDAENNANCLLKYFQQLTNGTN